LHNLPNTTIPPNPLKFKSTTEQKNPTKFQKNYNKNKTTKSIPYENHAIEQNRKSAKPYRNPERSKQKKQVKVTDQT
jgi:hypothetical protein